MLQKLCMMFAVLLIFSTNGNASDNAIFSASSDTKSALHFIGASADGNNIQGNLVTSGEYFEFSQELLDIWVKRDSGRLRNLLSQSTVDLYGKTDEVATLDQWSKGMTEHLLKCDRSNPKIFVTLVDDLPNNQMYIGQKQWFVYPETPSVALLLYSYDAGKKQLLGRMLYPVKQNGQFRLLLEKPKE